MLFRSIKNGFMPAKREDEKLCPGTTVEILTDITDVTERINKATEGAENFLKARDGAIAAIEELGQPAIDMVLGVSVGSLVGSLLAFRLPAARILSELERVIIRSKPYSLKLPDDSLFSLKNSRRALQEFFGPSCLEDAWLPFQAFSANLSRKQLQGWRRGRWPALPGGAIERWHLAWWLSFPLGALLLATLMSTKEFRFVLPLLPQLLLLLGLLLADGGRWLQAMAVALGLSGLLACQFGLGPNLTGFTPHLPRRGEYWPLAEIVATIRRQSPQQLSTLAVLPDSESLNAFNLEAEGRQIGRAHV